MNEVYITRLSKFLPNKPISNDDMEHYLGLINGKPSLARRIVLDKNKITRRYYALDEKGNSTHSNAQMAALALKELEDDRFSLNDVQVFACGTTSPDQLIPSHASMVHGFINSKNAEIVSFAGACCSSMHALKYGFLSVCSGNSSNAACAGSEKLSTWLKSTKYENESNSLARLKKNAFVAFEKEFQRWMLSDGAAAALVQNKPTEDINLRIEWIETTSFAGKLETCMYSGCEKLEDGKTLGWHDLEPNEWIDRSIFSLQQDVRLLKCNIIQLGQKFLEEICEKRNFNVQSVDHFLPHLSSDFFREPIKEALINAKMPIPEEKWFTNLATVGNVGSASPLLILEELFVSGRLKKGEKILMMVPESARFSYAYCLLTVC